MTTERRAEIERGIAVLSAGGVCWRDWARERGVSVNVVHNVRRGASRCSRGQAHAVAESLALIGRTDVSMAAAEAAANGRMRLALQICESLLAEQLDADLEDLRELGRSPSVLLTLHWDRSAVLDRCQRLNAAVSQAREALGSAPEAPDA